MRRVGARRRRQLQIEMQAREELLPPPEHRCVERRQFLDGSQHGGLFLGRDRLLAQLHAVEPIDVSAKHSGYVDLPDLRALSGCEDRGHWQHDTLARALLQARIRKRHPR